MRIEGEKFTIELTGGEAIDLAYHIKRSLEQSIVHHYISKHHDRYNKGVQHAIDLFNEQAKDAVIIMKALFVAGFMRCADWAEIELVEYIKKKYAEKHGDSSANA